MEVEGYSRYSVNWAERVNTGAGFVHQHGVIQTRAEVSSSGQLIIQATNGQNLIPSASSTQRVGSSLVAIMYKVAAALWRQLLGSERGHNRNNSIAPREPPKSVCPRASLATIATEDGSGAFRLARRLYQ
ncbi:hypothetical protein RRG08_038641 [Elysia crispata]|uniref:Uncharacterized protein n=1 Tax=Elysia crispata TaxID=231223 RepID=A0AAE1D174_9GAST|nr:hypothetical protein RRG08_038641 [Elysia crispata]